MKIRDRIKELRRVPASSLQPHPRNWRTHPSSQRQALHAVLDDIGYADTLLVREMEDGNLELIDGHLRAELTPEAVVPVLVLDLDEHEAERLLLTHDPIAAMAQADAKPLGELIGRCDFADDAVRQMLDEVASQTDARAADEPAAGASEVVVPESYQVVVECQDEAEQRSVFERMQEEGYRCQLLTL